MASRRAFMQGLGIAGVGALGVTLTSCQGGGGGGATPTATPTAASTLPNYLPFQETQPDGASTPEGVMAMFLSFPSERPSFGASARLTTGDIAILCQTDGAAPPLLGENTFWQAINSELGANLNFNMVPAADLAAKQSVAIASGDVPDFMQIKGRKSVPQMAQMLEANFQDLSEVLGGAGVEDYPGLANIPTSAWETCVFDGRIYGIPQTSGRVGDILFTREDLLQQHGLTSRANDEEEFLEICKALTDPGQQKWALNSATTVFTYLRECLGAGFDWMEVDGELVHYVEQEQTREALAFTARLWSEGVVHPDAFSGSGALTEWFSSGITAMNRGGLRFADIVLNANAGTNPDLSVGLMPPFSFGGAEPIKHLVNGTAGFTAIKKSEPDRLEELLQVANWFAPPFGTEESLFRNYGIEGEHFTFEDGEPVLTETGAAQTRLPLAYTFRPPQVLYSPGRPESAQAQYDYQVEVIPYGVPSAVDLLQSDTDERNGGTITRTLDDMRDSVIQGRNTLDDWDAAVASWKSAGGDRIRDEYMAARDAQA